MNKLPMAERAKEEARPIRTWMRPELRRLWAGAAEQGGGLNTDLGFGHS